MASAPTAFRDSLTAAAYVSGDTFMAQEQARSARFAGAAARVLSPGFCAAIFFFAWGAPTCAKSIVAFDVPGATAQVPVSINSESVIVGSYEDKNQVTHGFVRFADGTFSTVDVPGSTFTALADINDSGVIVGTFQTKAPSLPGHSPPFGHPGVGGTGHGFVMATDGTITPFDPPGSIQTAPQAINAKGESAGSFRDSANVTHGFVRNAKGKITTFDGLRAEATVATGINAGGSVVGQFIDPTGFLQAYVRAPDGTITEIDPPGETTGASADAINRKGTITGEYADNAGSHGFVRAADGTITEFDAFASTNTDPVGIDDNGKIVGDYVDNDQGSRGFERRGNGSIGRIDFPRAESTTPFSISSSNAFVTGLFSKGGTLHCFILSP